MAAASFLGYCYFAYLAKPAGDRPLYRHLRKHPAVRVVELGVGDGLRTSRLLQVLQRYLKDETIQYTGIDLFEARGKGSGGLPLKEAYRRLKPLGAAVQLIPGDAHMALARCANTLVNTDLLLIAADQQTESLAKAWKFVPRMLHAGTRIFLERPVGENATKWTAIEHGEIHQLASSARIATRRAA